MPSRLWQSDQVTSDIGTEREPYQPSLLRKEREAAARRASVRSILTAVISTIVVLGVLALIIRNSPGWPRVQESFFDGPYFWESLPRVAAGLWLNLRVMLIAALCISVLGSLVAIARTTSSPLLTPVRLIATVYTDIFRGLPLIIVMLGLGLGVPALRISWLPNNIVFYGGLALVLTYSAYVAEVLRAGIEAVNQTQRMAARALGLSQWQTLRYVVAPQALRKVTPALLNDLVSLQKDSGLISILGAIDAVRAAGIMTAKAFNFTPYVVAGLLFMMLTIPLTRVTDAIARKIDRRSEIGIPI